MQFIWRTLVHQFQSLIHDNDFKNIKKPDVLLYGQIFTDVVSDKKFPVLMIKNT